MIERALRRPLIVTLVVAAATFAWHSWTDAAGVHKTSGLFANEPNDAKIDVIVSLDFAPESFHITRAQDVGQLVKIDGKRMYMRGVQRAPLAHYARAFWVDKIEAWNASN